MNIIGHKKIQNILDKSIEKDNISHAYLFCGPESLGKFRLAMEMAKKITYGEEGKINPDIAIVQPERLEKNGVLKKEDIKIEKIRELKKQMSTSSYGGKYKVAIIDDADRMNRSAQNALLKILEEPPRKSVLILISKANNNLLPTILSRCQLIKFNLVSAREMEKNIPESKDKEEIIFWSLGRPGLAMSFLENKKELERRKEIAAEFNKLFSQNFSEKSIFAEAESKNITSLMEKMNLWVIILREWVLGNRKKTVISREKSFYLMESIEKSVKTISETNANARLVLENLFLEF